MEDYSFNEHKHRYAVWTAARAQRAFAKNLVIAQIIEKANLRAFVETTTTLSQDEFDTLHREWCTNIMNCGVVSCDYGRAAKMVAIYLKTAVILPHVGQSPLCDVIHPPIDRILLQNIAAKTAALKHFKKLNWTTLKPDAYWAVVNDIRSTFGKCNWTTEEYWSLNNEDE